MGAVLRDVRGGGPQTDEREIAGDHDEDHRESDELWPERNGQMDAEVEVRPRRPCNFSEEGDDHEMRGDFHESHRNEEE